MRGRHRLGHRPLLHRLRAARERRHVGDLRGRARLPGQGPLVGDRRDSTASRSSTRRPTAIRACIKWGDEYPEKHDLSSLRLLGSVGEPINPRAWVWYHKVIGGERCPIVDTWWQTETGHIMITPLPGITETKPGSATQPFPGVEAAVVNKDGDDRRGGRRLPHAAPPLARHGAHALQGGRALRRDLLDEVRQRRLRRGRRREDRRGRLLLDRRAHRRRDQRLGPPDVDDGDRVGDRLAREGGRGRRASARRTRTPARRSSRS